MAPPKDPEMAAIAEEFMRLTGADRDTYEGTALRKKDLGYSPWNVLALSQTIGLCEWFSDLQVPAIDVDDVWWSEADEGRKWALVMHEMGHCVCSLPHSPSEVPMFAELMFDLKAIGLNRAFQYPGFFDDGCPESLMYPAIQEARCIRDHRQQYVDRMVRDCRKYNKILRLIPVGDSAGPLRGGRQGSHQGDLP